MWKTQAFQKFNEICLWTNMVVKIGALHDKGHWIHCPAADGLTQTLRLFILATVKSKCRNLCPTFI